MSTAQPEISLADTLTPQQQQVIALLASGRSVTIAAKAVDLHRTTIHHWSRTNPDFAQALREAKHDRAQEWQAAADPHADAAFTLVRQLIDDETAPKSVRLKAALTIIQQVTKEPAPPSDEQLAAERIQRATLAVARQDMEEEIAARAEIAAHQKTHTHVPGECTCLHCLAVNDYLDQQDETRRRRAEQQQAQQNSSQFITSTQKQQPYVRPTPKIGRNEKCPCGSNRKYKQCCLNKKAA